MRLLRFTFISFLLCFAYRVPAAPPAHGTDLAATYPQTPLPEPFDLDGSKARIRRQDDGTWTPSKYPGGNGAWNPENHPGGDGIPPPPEQPPGPPSEQAPASQSKAQAEQPTAQPEEQPEEQPTKTEDGQPSVTRSETLETITQTATCTSHGADYNLDLNWLREIIETFCNEATEQGVQDENSGAVTRRYRDGDHDEIRIVMDWPPGHEEKPQKGRCVRDFTALYETCFKEDDNSIAGGSSEMGYLDVYDVGARIGPAGRVGD